VGAESAHRSVGLLADGDPSARDSKQSVRKGEQANAEIEINGGGPTNWSIKLIETLRQELSCG